MEKSLFTSFYIIARTKFKSDAQLANAIGISRGSLGSYTRDKNPISPKLSTIEKWCKSLNIEIKEDVFVYKE